MLQVGLKAPLSSMSLAIRRGKNPPRDLLKGLSGPALQEQHHRQENAQLFSACDWPSLMGKCGGQEPETKPNGGLASTCK